MAKVAVLGAGVMGTAMTIPLADNGHEVRLIGTHLDDEIIDEIRARRAHPRLRTSVPEAVQPYHLHQLADALDGIDLLILGVNSHGISWAAQILGPAIPENTPLVMVAKGLVGENNQIHILPGVLRRMLPESTPIAAVGGPSIANELADRRHTSIVLAGSKVDDLERYAVLLRTSYYHIWSSTDMVGVEVSVAMKNIYAVGVGFVYGQLEKEGAGADGMPVHNPAAAVFAQGLRETAYLVEYLGGDLRSVYSLPGAGDGFVTCQGGRNMQIGRRMGKGKTYEEATAMYKPTERPEGPPLAIAIGPTIRAMIASGKLDGDKLPLLCNLINVFVDGYSFEIPWDAFFR